MSDYLKFELDISYYNYKKLGKFMFFKYHNIFPDELRHPHSKEVGHDHTHEDRSSKDSSGSSLNDN